jgi:outer membrane protein OmpA-like peptidoglycan-associated protein
MDSFGLSIVALAAMVSPGVLFVVFFFGSSQIKRPSITFGPAIDIAAFFSMSVVINGFYGGCIVWLTLRFLRWLGDKSIILDLVSEACNLASNSDASGGSPLFSALCLCSIYLFLITITSAIIGTCSSRLYEWSGDRLVHGIFTDTAKTSIRGGVTLCSVLTKFGVQGTKTSVSVVYVGLIKEITLNDKTEINFLMLEGIRRTSFRIGSGIGGFPPALDSSLELEKIPGLGDRAEFVIPGDSIENVAFSHILPEKPQKEIKEQSKKNLAYRQQTQERPRKWKSFWRRAWTVLCFVLIFGPILPSILKCHAAIVYLDGKLRQCSNHGQPGEQTEFYITILNDLTAIAADLKPSPTPLPPTECRSVGIFQVHFDLKGWKLEDLTQLDMAQIKDAALASQGGVVEVSGYADSIGTPGENRKISEERARTVAKQLIADGVPVTNILGHALIK